MSEKNTIARPYAKAVFDVAIAQKQLLAWSNFLKALTCVVCDPLVARLVVHPQVNQATLLRLLLSILQDARFELDQKLFDTSAVSQNFIACLLDNRRLLFVPEISVLFEYYRAEYEKTIHVDVLSTMPLSDEQCIRLTNVLAQRLNRQVVVNCEIDSKLLGGFVIKAGDVVIDGSVKGKLIRLNHLLQGTDYAA